MPNAPRASLIANGDISVCKVAGPAGVYHFHIGVVGGGNYTIAGSPDNTVVFNGTTAACWTSAYVTANDVTWTPGLTATVTVTETSIPAGITVDSIQLVDGFGGREASVLHSASIVITEGATDLHTVKFYNAATPSVTCAAINAIAGAAITPVMLTASGGSGAPYTFSATGLPAGLMIASDGTITGTPTVTGSFPYTVTVADKNGHTGTSTCTVTVGPAPTASCVAISAVAGSAVTPVQMVGSGGAGGPYTFSAMGLPTGLTMASDGTISGTPTASGTFNYTVVVTDAAGNTGTVNCSVTVAPPPPVCTDGTATNFGGPLPCEYPPSCPDGSFTYTFVNSGGDLVIKYDQFPAPNDNSYGVNAVGWGTRAHKFSDLVGSDHAGFQLVDANGVVRLSFNVDYITADATAPSGYRSLGVLGGDGKMLIGTSSGITATTSLANNLNNINIPGLFSAAHVQQFGSVNLLVDSPPTDAAHSAYVVSDPTLAGWDFHNTYYVTISAAKLASLGFDPLTWSVEPNPDQLHNSPAKPCPTGGGASGGVSQTKTEIKGKEVKITLLNTGTSDIFLTDVLLDWPTSPNGKLMQVKLGKDVVYDKPDIAGGTAHLGTAQLVADANKRKIPKGKSEVLDFVFEKNVDPNLAHYASTVQFGSITVMILPK